MGRFALVAAAVAVSLAVVPLASCGDETGSPAKSPSASQAKLRVKKAVLRTGQLPSKWRPAPVQEHIEKPGLPRYCGVTVLPKPLAAARVDLYARYEVEPVTGITDVGEDAVGFQYKVQSGFTSGIVVFRRGDMLVTVVDLGPQAVPYATVRSVAGTVDDRIA